jgi:hypothetical protein
MGRNASRVRLEDHVAAVAASRIGGRRKAGRLRTRQRL